MGVEPGAPLLVPVPLSPDAGGSAPHDDTRAMEHALSRDQQLRELMARGFGAHEAAPYCDGESGVDALARLIASDAAALEEDEKASLLARTPRGGRKASVGGNASSACVVS